MTELSRHIEPQMFQQEILVGGREGFMFGQYKRLRNEFTGILTGRDFLWVH
jgi:glutamate dehydrogenase (NADP+)